MDLATELIKLGPPGLICIVLYIMLYRSEKREEKKDSRIQILETQLKDSYDNRILDNNKVSEAVHNSAVAATNAAKALDVLSVEIRSRS